MVRDGRAEHGGDHQLLRGVKRVDSIHDKCRRLVGDLELQSWPDDIFRLAIDSLGPGIVEQSVLVLEDVQNPLLIQSLSPGAAGVPSRSDLTNLQPIQVGPHLQDSVLPSVRHDRGGCEHWAILCHDLHLRGLDRISACSMRSRRVPLTAVVAVILLEN
jgi:hypothetical protein